MFEELLTVIKPSVETSSEQEMHIRRSLREVSVYVAFAIGYDGDLRSLLQDVCRSLHAREPAARLLVSRCAARMRHGPTLLAIPDRNIGKPKKFTSHGINRENRMQKHAAKLAALAHRPIAARPCLPASKNDLARILNGQHFSPKHPLRRAQRRTVAQARHCHRGIAQKAAEADLAATPAIRQSQNTGARRSHQRLMTPGPLF